MQKHQVSEHLEWHHWLHYISGTSFHYHDMPPCSKGMQH